MAEASGVSVPCDVTPGRTVSVAMVTAVDSVRTGEVESLVVIPVGMDGDTMD